MAIKRETLTIIKILKDKIIITEILEFLKMKRQSRLRIRVTRIKINNTSKEGIILIYKQTCK